jgi:4'-phosphopantetheinyl transferase EntD
MVRARAVTRSPERGGGGAEHLDPFVDQVLTSAERAAWIAVVSPRRRRHWLGGRIAAKDAVRHLVRDATGVLLHPAEVEILAGPRGAPMVATSRALVGASRVMVSIAHIDEAAVAIACADPQVQGIGIDVERFRARRAVERFGLNVGERRDLGGLADGPRTELALRFWCAKEAVSKAIGTGMFPLGGPGALTVERLDEHGAQLLVHVAASTEGDARSLRAATRCEDDLVVATAVAWERCATRAPSR